MMSYALILAHLIGDYPLQSHTMALKKTSDGRWAAVHALFYGVPFVAILVAGVCMQMWALGPAALAWVVIVGTHAVIDRYGLARRWCVWYGVGHPGLWWKPEMCKCGHTLSAHIPPGVEVQIPLNGGIIALREGECATDCGCEKPEPEEFSGPPPVLGMVLQIVVDNTLHMLINGLCFWMLTP